MTEGAGKEPVRPDGRRSWLWGPHSRIGLITGLITLVVDQVHKWWMILGLDMQVGDRFALLPFLEIVYVLNTGISYSLFDSASYGWQLTLAVFAALVAAAMWVWMARGEGGRLMAISLGLIIGGAVGNAIDRVLLGGVADFFLLHGYGFTWYVFNIADVAIVAGVIGLLYDSVASSRNTDTKGA